MVGAVKPTDTMVMNMDTLTWSAGPTLPFGVAKPLLTRWDDDGHEFILAGGHLEKRVF